MVLVAAVLVAALSVVVSGGAISNLGRLRLRARWTIVLALGVQVVIISVIPAAVNGWVGQLLQLVSYALGAAFLLANRHVPWLWLVGLGGLLNLIAIGANDGVMPASAKALRAAGRVAQKGRFINSRSLPHPRLAFLGDIFSVPRHLPLANVFSIGDVLLALGALLLLHAVCGSRPSLALQRTLGRAGRWHSAPGPAQ